MFSTLVLGFILAAPAPADTDDRVKADLKAFATFLGAEFKGKKWQTGPVQIDSDALRAAYGTKVRFYCVNYDTPLAPGANIADLQQRHREQVAELERTHVRMTVRIDEQGKIFRLEKPADFTIGLMPLKTDDDIKVAAAALLSLLVADRCPVGAIAPKDVTVTKTDSGWSATTNLNFAAGFVSFDSARKIMAISKHYNGPLPPSAFPRKDVPPLPPQPK